MYSRIIKLSLGALLLLSGLGCKSDREVCLLPETSVVSSFPGELIMTSSFQLPSQGTEGAMDILALDSCLVISRNHPRCLVAIDKADGTLLGSCLNKGRSQHEVLRTVFFGDCSFAEDSSEVIMGLQTQPDVWMKIDLKESFRQGQVSVREITQMPGDIGLFAAELADGSFLGKRIEENGSRYVRSSQHIGGEPMANAAMAELNKASLETKGDPYAINALSSFFGYNRALSRVVEVSCFLNTIHLYDMAGTVAKTIIVGKKARSYRDVEQDLVRKGESERFSLKLRTYPDFFVILGGDGKTMMQFDWEGKPYQKIILQEPITSFDIDVYSGTLYTLNSETEEIRGYNIASYGKMYTSGKRF